MGPTYPTAGSNPVLRGEQPVIVMDLRYKSYPVRSAVLRTCCRH